MRRKKIKLRSTEVEVCEKRVETLLAEKKIIYDEEIDNICKDLNQEDKQEVKAIILKKAYIVKKKDEYNYEETKTVDEVHEELIFSSLIKPEFVNNQVNYIQVGNKYYVGIYCTEFPNVVSQNWLSSLASAIGNIDFSIHITPISKLIARSFLNRTIKRLNIDLYKDKYVKKVGNPELEQKIEKFKQTLSDIQAGVYKLFRVTLVLVAKGDTYEDAETLAKSIKSALSADGIESEYADKQHENALRSIIPIGKNHLKDKTILIPGNSLANSFPFSFTWLQVDEEEGTLLGFNEVELAISKSLWKLNSYNGAICGMTGSGKSFCVKLFADEENTCNGTKIVVIDPAATTGARPEYKDMCKKKNGNYVALSTDSENIPNIMALYHGSDEETYEDEMRRVAYLIEVLLAGDEPLPEPQKRILFKAIPRTYERKGITKKAREYWKIAPPTLDDLWKVLLTMKRDYESQQMKISYEAIVGRLEKYVGDGLFNFMNTQEGILNIDNPFTVFEFKKVPKDVKPIMTAVVMNYVKSKAMGNLDKTIIILEEAHLWLKHPELANFLGELIVLVRKSNTGIWLIFQDLGQFQEVKEALTLLGNLNFNFIFQTKSNLINLTAQTFDLNDVEKDIILNAKRGEGILIWGGNHFRIQTDTDEETKMIISTAPKDQIVSSELEEDKAKDFLSHYLRHEVEDINDAAEEFYEKYKQSKSFKLRLDEAPDLVKEKMRKIKK